MFYIIRFFLFLFPAETAHNITLKCLKIPFLTKFLKVIYSFEKTELIRNIGGLNFKSPIGLAAGLDKNGEYIDQFADLGFGFIEIGTVTPKGQEGNPKPRLFRLKEDKGIINRMGFNNKGVETVASSLKNRKSSVIVGGNIGKNKITSNENAINDYLISFNALFDFVDYFVINVSSPNTPNLRNLQEKEPLKKLLETVQSENSKKDKMKPIFLKIAPDLTEGQLDDMIEVLNETKIAGIIVTNTTLAREGLRSTNAVEQGGLSGKPLFKKSTEIIRYLSSRTDGKMAIIAVGGIFSAKDALEKIDAGASLVQIYTGFIYQGPALIKKIKKALIKK
jgi:dihydroorotate dehydrogenase